MISRKKAKKDAEDIIRAIDKCNDLVVLEHPNRAQYPDQYILAVPYANYVYAVPCERTQDGWKLITAYPSRKLKQYMNTL